MSAPAIRSLLLVALVGVVGAGCRGTSAASPTPLAFPDLAGYRPAAIDILRASLGSGVRVVVRSTLDLCETEGAATREQLDRAVVRAGRAGSFDLTVDAGAFGSFAFTGVRAADASTALAPAPHGGVQPTSSPADVVARSTVRITDGRLFVRSGSEWTDAGSSAGTTLDVGREQLAHRWLVRMRRPASRCAAPSGDVDLPALVQRAADHGDSAAVAAASSIRALDWTAEVASGRLSSVRVDVRGPLRARLRITTSWEPGAPSPDRVAPVPRPFGARTPEHPLGPADLLLLLARAT